MAYFFNCSSSETKFTCIERCSTYGFWGLVFVVVLLSSESSTFARNETKVANDIVYTHAASRSGANAFCYFIISVLDAPRLLTLKLVDIKHIGTNSSSLGLTVSSSRFEAGSHAMQSEEIFSATISADGFNSKDELIRGHSNGYELIYVSRTGKSGGKLLSAVTYGEFSLVTEWPNGITTTYNFTTQFPTEHVKQYDETMKSFIACISETSTN